MNQQQQSPKLEPLSTNQKTVAGTLQNLINIFYKWATTRNFQQYDIFTSVDSDEPV